MSYEKRLDTLYEDSLNKSTIREALKVIKELVIETGEVDAELALSSLQFILEKDYDL